MLLSMEPILTLEARGNVLLRVMTHYLGMSDAQIRREILLAHQFVIDRLAEKGIAYRGLRSALVPRPDRFEAGFLFDSTLIDSGWYGLDVARMVLPLLGKNQNGSILIGDLIHTREENAQFLLKHYLRANRPTGIPRSSLVFCVYLNNLTGQILMDLVKGLRSNSAYMGYVEVRRASPMKEWLSLVLSRIYVKRGTVFICAETDDHDEDSDENSPSWPVSDYGSRVASIPETYFGLFLSYKIERAVYRGFEEDGLFALRAISAAPSELEECSVLVEEAKVEYLRSEKTGSLKRAGLLELDGKQLSDLIRSRVLSNYIYNLRHVPERKQSLFDIVIEVASDSDASGAFRLLAALEYNGLDKQLRLVTLY
jgi:hypothetical protein